MTRLTRFDDQLAGWFEADAAAPVPSDLAGRVLDRTRGRRPRRRWLATLNELPVGGASLRVVPGRMGRAAWFGAVLMLVLIVAVAAVVGSQLLRERQVDTRIVSDPLLARDAATVTRLADGRLLLVGGWGMDGPSSGAAVADPWTGKVTAVPMDRVRVAGVTATLLDDGRVLVTGDVDTGGGSFEESATADVFDPETGSFAPVGDMAFTRGWASVIKSFVPVTVRLTDGRVLVVGGTTEQDPTRSFPAPGEVFDPVTGTFSPTPPLPCVGEPDGGNSGQEVRTADLLPDGRVLLSCERWWSSRYAAPVEPGTPEQRFLAFDLESGAAEPVEIGTTQVVSRTLAMPDRSLLLWVASGSDRISNGERSDRFMLQRLKPSNMALRDLGVEVTRSTAIGLLDSGHLVAIGGYEPGTGTPGDQVRLLEPCTGALTPVTSLPTTWVGGTVTQLDGRHLLLVGGQLGQDPDMFEPVPPQIVTLTDGLPPACTG